MLPIANIDDETYDEIVRYLKNNIPVYSSEWSDFNEHDPGITFLELFAWLKEAQQFYMMQTVKRLEPQFLRLLGAEQRHRHPASAAVRLDHPENDLLREGTPFYADDICFVLDRDEYCYHAGVKSVAASDGTIFEVSDRADFGIFVFGKSPKIGDGFTVSFTEALIGGRIRLYFTMAEYGFAKRNPLAEGYRTLADFSVQAFADNAWTDVGVISDGTNAFTESGYLELLAAENTTAVRFVLERADYDVPPMISAVEINRFRAAQREELAVSAVASEVSAAETSEWRALFPLSYALENGKNVWFCSDGDGYVQITDIRREYTDNGLEVRFSSDIEVSSVIAVSVLSEKPRLFECDGLSFSELDTELLDIDYDCFELMVFDSARERWYPWEKTDLLRGAGTRREYSLDEDSGRLSFGDGTHGMIPKGKIMITSLSRTLAERGNIKDSRITRCGAENVIGNGAEIVGVHGGAPRETPRECLSRFQSEAVLKRAVTASDYEEIVRAVPGLMVKNCLAAVSDSEENCVDIIVEPYSLSDMAERNPVYEENIQKYLFPKKLVGTKINLMFPTYIELDFYISVKAAANKRRAEEQIREILRSVFSERLHRFGITVPYNEIYAQIDLADEVASVEALDITARDDGVVTSGSRDITLPKNSVAVIGRVEIKATS